MNTRQPSSSELIAYSQSTSWRPHYSEATVKYFLESLISGPQSIFDLQDAEGRLACAVLLENVDNASNDAMLEVLGIRDGVDPEPILRELLASARAPGLSRKTGLQLTLDSAAVDDPLELGSKLGLDFYFSMYEMERAGVAVDESFSPPPEIRLATPLDADTVFDLLVAAFQNAPDVNIPSREDWRKRFLNRSSQIIYLFEFDGRAVGWVHLELTAEMAEVRTLGVLPITRKKGIGATLLKTSLARAEEEGRSRIALSVAVKNEKALGLYLREGFKVMAKQECFRKDFVR